MLTKALCSGTCLVILVVSGLSRIHECRPPFSSASAGFSCHADTTGAAAQRPFEVLNYSLYGETNAFKTNQIKFFFSKFKTLN